MDAKQQHSRLACLYHNKLKITMSVLLSPLMISLFPIILILVVVRLVQVAVKHRMRQQAPRRRTQLAMASFADEERPEIDSLFVLGEAYDSTADARAATLARPSESGSDPESESAVLGTGDTAEAAMAAHVVAALQRVVAAVVRNAEADTTHRQAQADADTHTDARTHAHACTLTDGALVTAVP
jgi:hypothetical protein